MRTALRMFALLVICLLLVSCDNNPLHYQDELQQGQRDGDLIIAVIDVYNADQGVYPEDLDSLVPDYLDEIPKAPHGRFEYKISIYGTPEVSFDIFRHFRKSYSCNSWVHSTLGRIWDCGYCFNNCDW
ncbi:hypothetical protein JR338_04900 [Chloroflexota bacterium]|nr:hypothetical protein JR338_04900 [Chloroflexota bacterium]